MLKSDVEQLHKNRELESNCLLNSKLTLKHEEPRSICSGDQINLHGQNKSSWA